MSGSSTAWYLSHVVACTWGGKKKTKREGQNAKKRSEKKKKKTLHRGGGAAGHACAFAAEQGNLPLGDIQPPPPPPYPRVIVNEERVPRHPAAERAGARVGDVGEVDGRCCLR